MPVPADDEAPSALWEAVCEGFAERSIGPGLEPGAHEVAMALGDAPRAMARLLAEEGRHGA